MDVTGLTEYGTLTVQGGIELEPHALVGWSGGPVDASLLGPGCSGFIGTAADWRVDLGVSLFGTNFDLVRFYFVGAGDTTLVVAFLQPNGRESGWNCNDDSYGTQHPTVDVVNPMWGSYKIWIGSVDPTETVFGTLFVTVVSDNHP